VREALATYPVHVLGAAIAQRVVFAEAAVLGRAVHEIDPNGVAADEVQAVLVDLMEYAK
jgi:chromosome partitioning protein